jgi:uncharacterized protein YggE
LAKSLKEARADNNKRVKAAVDALQALKIPNMRMKTSDVTVSLEKTHHKTGELTEIIGYRVTNTFTVVVQNDDVDKLGTLARLVLDTALENGANIVEHISFFKREVGQFRREALAKAVEDATANAKALAGGAKVELREPVTIHGQPEYHLGRYNMDNRQQALAPGGGGDEAPMVAGNLTITCKVSVSYTY